ncbi:MAG: branched-chain amino acid ABC transporter permease [Candidatus Aminicenantes bacterium]|nr:branched-chain amino acid ABC transporter permease [Candidatus Aminicenantes bacterium]
MLVQLLINGMITGAVYALAALGFSLIYRSTKIFHIAHAAVFTSAAYFLYFFYNQARLDLLSAILLSLLCTGILGVLMEITVYNPLFKNEASSSIMLVSSIGIMTIVINTIAMIWGNETKIILSGISKTVKINNLFSRADSPFKEIILTIPQLYQLFVSILAIVFVMAFLQYSKSGKKIKAICDNDRLVEIFGVSLSRFRIMIFFIGSVMAGLGSILFAVDFGMDPYVGMPVLLIAAVAVIVGGVEYPWGAVLGGFLLGFAKALVVSKMSARWENMIVFLLLIFFLLFRPEGILSRKKRRA